MHDKCWCESASTQVDFSLAPLQKETLNLTYEETVLILKHKKTAKLSTGAWISSFSKNNPEKPGRVTNPRRFGPNGLWKCLPTQTFLFQVQRGSGQDGLGRLLV